MCPGVCHVINSCGLPTYFGMMTLYMRIRTSVSQWHIRSHSLDQYDTIYNLNRICHCQLRIKDSRYVIRNNTKQLLTRKLFPVAQISSSDLRYATASGPTQPMRCGWIGFDPEHERVVRLKDFGGPI